jgi:hypothetical protein
MDHNAFIALENPFCEILRPGTVGSEKFWPEPRVLLTVASAPFVLLSLACYCLKTTFYRLIGLFNSRDRTSSPQRVGFSVERKFASWLINLQIEFLRTNAYWHDKTRERCFVHFRHRNSNWRSRGGRTIRCPICASSLSLGAAEWEKEKLSDV